MPALNIIAIQETVLNSGSSSSRPSGMLPNLPAASQMHEHHEAARPRARTASRCCASPRPGELPEAVARESVLEEPPEQERDGDGRGDAEDDLVDLLRLLGRVLLDDGVEGGVQVSGWSRASCSPAGPQPGRPGQSWSVSCPRGVGALFGEGAAPSLFWSVAYRVSRTVVGRPPTCREQHRDLKSRHRARCASGVTNPLRPQRTSGYGRDPHHTGRRSALALAANLARQKPRRCSCLGSRCQSLATLTCRSRWTRWPSSASMPRAGVGADLAQPGAAPADDDGLLATPLDEHVDPHVEQRLVLGAALARHHLVDDDRQASAAARRARPRAPPRGPARRS